MKGIVLDNEELLMTLDKLSTILDVDQEIIVYNLVMSHWNEMKKLHNRVLIKF